MADLFSNPAAVAGLLPTVVAKSGPVRRRLLDWNFHHFDWAPPGMKPELELQFLKTRPDNAIAVWTVDSTWTPGPGPGQHFIALVPAT
jgi:hypothetical protein